MTLESIIAQILPAIIVAIPVYILLQANLNKIKAESYVHFVDALNKSGHTIDDLMDMIDEMPKLKNDLIVAQNNIDELSRALSKMNKRADFFVEFAKVNWLGAQANAEYIRQNHKEVPPYEPPVKFPTGPLPATEVKA